MQNKKTTFDRRSALRISCQSQVFFKVCKEETISQIMEGYTQNVSKDGLCFTITEKVPVGCTLWLKLDKDTITLCEEMEKSTVILQQGILGKVKWIQKIEQAKFEIGLQFITREQLHP